MNDTQPSLTDEQYETILYNPFWNLSLAIRQIETTNPEAGAVLRQKFIELHHIARNMTTEGKALRQAAQEAQR